MTKPYFRPYIRWKEQCTPSMKGHMRLYYRLYKYVKHLPKTRRNSMLEVGRRFNSRLVSEW